MNACTAMDIKPQKVVKVREARQLLEMRDINLHLHKKEQLNLLFYRDCLISFLGLFSKYVHFPSWKLFYLTFLFSLPRILLYCYKIPNSSNYNLHLYFCPSLQAITKFHLIPNQTKISQRRIKQVTWKTRSISFSDFSASQ